MLCCLEGEGRHVGLDTQMNPGGDRLGVQVKLVSSVCYLLWAVQKAPRARTRAGVNGPPPVCAR